MFALVLGMGARQAAFAQSTNELLLSGRIALEEERYDFADSVLALIPGSADDFGQALALRARSAFDQDRKAEGSTLLDQAREISSDSPEFISVDLWRRWKYPSQFLPLLQDIRLKQKAHKILAADSSIAMAHIVLGAMATEEFIDLRSAVSVPALENTASTIRAEAEANAALLLTPTLSTSDSGGDVQFEYRGYGRRDDVVSLQKPGAQRKFEAAYDRLQKALGGDPFNMKGYRVAAKLLLVGSADSLLLDLSQSMREYLPRSSLTWLLSGYAEARNGDVERAEHYYERALSYTTNEESALLTNPERIFGNEESAAYPDPNRDAGSYWAGRDPRYLTSANERRLEHFNRMVYAEFRFGDMFSRRRGWDTEPGKVVVRYGVPLAEAQTSTMLDKYLAFVYEDFSFKFMDLSKAGKYTFYSPPPGSAVPSFESIRIAQEDQSIVSREMFRERPTRFVYNANNRRVPFPYRITRFKSSSSDSVDIIVTSGIDLQLPEFAESAWPMTIRSGLYVIQSDSIVARYESTNRISEQPKANTQNDYQLAITAKTVTAMHGDANVSVEFDAGEAVGFERSSVTLPRYGQEEWVSDLLVAYGIEESARANNPSAISRNGLMIRTAPWGVFSVGQPIYLYFEIYLRYDRAAEFEIETRLVKARKKTTASRVARLFRNRKSGVASGFVHPSDGKTSGLNLIIDSNGQKPGSYVLAIRVKDVETGESSVKYHSILLQ